MHLKAKTHPLFNSTNSIIILERLCKLGLKEKEIGLGEFDLFENYIGFTAGDLQALTKKNQ